MSDDRRPATPAELQRLWRLGYRTYARGWELALGVLAGAGLVAVGWSYVQTDLKDALGHAIVGGDVPDPSPIVALFVVILVVRVLLGIMGTWVGGALGVRTRQVSASKPLRLGADPARTAIGVVLLGCLGALALQGLGASSARAVDASARGLGDLLRAWGVRGVGVACALAVVFGAWERWLGARRVAELAPALRRSDRPTARRG